MENRYDIIVAGGGHSGIESALAGARIGCSVLLITFTKNKIGYLSCNPAVGGVGKGQLVKEIDALGGEMAKITDNAGIQFRILNRSKGPAVWSSRAQVDRNRYMLHTQNIINKEGNIDVMEGEVTGIIVENNRIKGVETDGETILGKAVILTPGTFLNGKMHIGLETISGGRMEEAKASKKLSANLKKFGFEMLRFKTGTCARFDGKTINFNKLRAQYGDTPPVPFSFSTTKIKVRQIPCYITYTNEDTHQIIRENLSRSPLFSGIITGTGVRYCPSLEDKVIKFPHHTRHHIFLEPEGLDTDTYYPNGISTSLPIDIQDRFIRTIKGLEEVRIERYGYGIEHDVVEPTQLYPTLETKSIECLYLAGQINGTTGYEEAAAQGIIAGINAALKIKKQPPLILDRATAYIGVLIDDLTTKGTKEPYRMFTSRVEYRLLLREDNADLRLQEIAYRLGLINKDNWEKTRHKKQEMEELTANLKKENISLQDSKITLYEHLIKPDIRIKTLIPENKYSEEVMRGTEIEIKYSPYVKQMLAEIKELRNLERVKIPEGIDYNAISGLSLEIKEKLSSFKPINLGQASRISGITPAAVSILLVYLKKFRLT